MKLLSQGAEAKVYLIEGIENERIYNYNIKIDNLEYNFKSKYKYLVLKYRFPKRYRHHIIDREFRRIRTRRESRIIEKLTNVLNVPELVFKDEDNGILVIQYIDGTILRDYIDKTKDISVFSKLGEIVAKLHKNKIVHGDLTTNNFVLYSNRVYIIDFGLSYHSTRIEDFATDLHLFKEVVYSKHWYISDQAWNAFINSYSREFPEKSKDVLTRLNKIEERGRYK